MRGLHLWSAASGLGVMLVLVAWRGFFWQHALLVGLAIGALVYSTVRTAERMRRRD